MAENASVRLCDCMAPECAPLLQNNIPDVQRNTIYRMITVTCDLSNGMTNRNVRTRILTGTHKYMTDSQNNTPTSFYIMV